MLKEIFVMCGGMVQSQNGTRQLSMYPLPPFPISSERMERIMMCLMIDCALGLPSHMEYYFAQLDNPETV